MKILVTGSSGHLGEALVRRLSAQGHEPIGLDVLESPYTTALGSITDPGFVEAAVQEAEAVIHAATLHKPHVGTHSRQAFVDTNITGTLNLLEAAVKFELGSFVFTSTTSVFGDAMRPAPGAPAVWVTEKLRPRPRNIYGVTKRNAEQLVEMFHRKFGLPCVVLRTSRFFPEDDDNRNKRDAFDNDNLKLNELLFRRADIHDMVTAHERALECAPALGHDLFIVSATSPFRTGDAEELGRDAPAVLARRVPGYRAVYADQGWQMFASIGRVYDNARARQLLGWEPEYSFEHGIESLAHGRDYRSELARQVGAKGYHSRRFSDGPYPVEESAEIEAGHDR